jgi:hypothetical protein
LDHKYWKESRDVFDDDQTFFDTIGPDDVVLWLTDQSIAETANKLFSDRFNCAAFILRNGLSVEDPETLEYCNDPFMLPLNKFTYGEFKRLFSQRWPNLSIELYDVSPDHGGLWRGAKELDNDLDMSSFSEVGYPLHDYIYIYEWADSLKRLGNLAAMIKNVKLGVDCDGNWRNLRLNAFQAGTKP